VPDLDDDRIVEPERESLSHLAANLLIAECFQYRPVGAYPDAGSALFEALDQSVVRDRRFPFTATPQHQAHRQEHKRNETTHRITSGTWFVISISDLVQLQNEGATRKKPVATGDRLGLDQAWPGFSA